MNNYPFEIKLLVNRRPHMRDDNLEYCFMFGLGILKQIFDEERTDTSVTKSVFYYPERYMNIVEERSLWDRLAKYCPNLKSVEMYTQSVYIMQCTDRESILIVESKDEQENGLPQEATTGRLWRNNTHGFDFSKLNVI